ncbi:MAG: ATP-binding cassette domain-containing protein [Clostridia bacterium]
MSVLKVENLVKNFGETVAVNDISFSCEAGEIVGFVGKNGAGKSTTIRCVLNFLAPTSGKCMIDELDSQKDAKQIRSLCAYMPSDSMFPSSASAKDVFSLCLKFSTKSMQDVENLAKYFELDINKKINELSLGNRKKVSIIQALLAQKDLLILDEPTSGLDPLMQDKFFKLLLEQKQNGKTIFLSSHNLSEIEKYCDRAIIIKDGKIINEIDMKNTDFKKIQVVSYTLKTGEESSFESDESANEIILRLSKMDLKSVEIRSKSVEDEFIKYYEEGDNNAK